MVNIFLMIGLCTLGIPGLIFVLDAEVVSVLLPSLTLLHLIVCLLEVKSRCSDICLITSRLHYCSSSYILKLHLAQNVTLKKLVGLLLKDHSPLSLSKAIFLAILQP